VPEASPTYHTSRDRRWRPRRNNLRRPGHTLTIKTETMLFNHLAVAFSFYCRENALDTLSADAAQALRVKWTAEALGRESCLSWRDLGEDDVDLLKPYLILMADPTSEEKKAAYATAREDGQRRRLIHAIWEKAELIREITAMAATPLMFVDWLASTEGEKQVEEFGIRDAREWAKWLTTGPGVECYILSICDDEYIPKGWRNALLPYLENLAKTLEERKRAAMDPEYRTRQRERRQGREGQQTEVPF